jgi:hypothetical protein
MCLITPCDSSSPLKSRLTAPENNALGIELIIGCEFNTTALLDLDMENPMRHVTLACRKYFWNGLRLEWHNMEVLSRPKGVSLQCRRLLIGGRASPARASIRAINRRFLSCTGQITAFDLVLSLVQ